jgi:hypothetical protein
VPGGEKKGKARTLEGLINMVLEETAQAIAQPVDKLPAHVDSWTGESQPESTPRRRREGYLLVAPLQIWDPRLTHVLRYPYE